MTIQFSERADVVKLLIEGGTNSSNQIAQIEEDLYNYGMGSKVFDFFFFSFFIIKI